MKNNFVETSNVRNFHAALQVTNRRGAGEACIMVIEGVPGLGKTSTLQHWTAKNQCIYLRAKKQWRASWMVNELLEEIRVTPPHRFEDKYKLALNQVGQRLDRAHRDGQDFAIVIDEADFISRNVECMETMRDLSDGLEVPVIFVGMGRIRDNLKRFPQVMSRVSQYVEFRPASRDDVRALVDGLCEVKVGDDLIDFVHKVSKGFNREVKEAIASIERYGLRNRPRDGNGDAFMLGDMAGQFLMNDRQSGCEIKVPEFV
ncbi:MAG: ATP-binding protein [Ahrensia sp.]|nr:ATP-binding protein [Ahrensia sp.]